MRDRDLRTIFDSISDVVYKYRTTPEFRVEYISPSVFEVLGHRPDDFMKNPGLMRELVHEEYRTLFDSLLLAPHAVPTPVEMRHRRGDGLLICLEHSITPIREQGVVVGVIGVARDTTIRNQTEAGLRLKAARYELLSRSIRDVCFRLRLRPKAQFEYVSPSVSDLLGYEPEEFLADDGLVWNIIHDDDRPLLTTSLSDNDFIRLDWEGRFRRRDGSYIWLEIRSQTDYAGDIAVARTGIARDITRRKRAEDHLKTLVNQLADQQRFDSRRRSGTSGRQEAESA